METKNIIIDADFLLFQCTEGKYVKTLGFSKKSGSKVKAKKKYKEPLKPHKDKMKALIQDIVDEVSVAVLGRYKIGKTKVIFSDPNSNFRYDLFREYKGERPPRSDLWYRLHKWAMKKYGYVTNTEADDVCCYYGIEKGWIVASFDKDVKNNVPICFDVYHSRRHIVEHSPKQIRDFILIQNLTGDRTDNIAGIDGVAEITAIKLLDKYGWDWNGVVKAYENAEKPKGVSQNLTRDDAILCRRLICMRQWTPKKGVEIWQPPKS